MALLEFLSSAQNGRYFATAGAAAGLSEDVAKSAMTALAPAIAEKLKDKAGRDPDAFDQLLDLLEEGGDSSDLDDAEAMTGAEALSDGAAILTDLYGSPGAATKALGALAPDVGEDALNKIGAISATSVLAVLAASNAQALAGETRQVAGTGSNAGSGGGFFSVIIAALLKGLMQGASRQLAPKRRRRRNYSSYYGQRRPARRRRTRRPGLDDIFKSVLGGGRR
jgi:hypothetical protein